MKPGGSCSEKQGVNKGAWSKEEDEKLTHLPQPADAKGVWFGEDEEDLIIKLHGLLGNRWSLIAGRLPGRSGNEVKNYWNSHLKTKLESMGIDPDNHPPPGIHYVQTTASTSTSTGSTISCAATATATATATAKRVRARQKSRSNRPCPCPSGPTTASDNESDASSN